VILARQIAPFLIISKEHFISDLEARMGNDGKNSKSKD
jgi:hypothetical protein